MYLQPVPTGYEETEAAWANSAALFERMNVAVSLAAGRLRGVSVDLDVVLPTSPDADRLLDSVDRALLAGSMSARTRDVVRREIDGLSPVQARALAVGLCLGGPEFQAQ